MSKNMIIVYDYETTLHMEFNGEDSVTSVVNKFNQLYSNLSENAVGTVNGIVVSDSKVTMEMTNFGIKGVSRDLTDAEKLVYLECI